MTITLPQLIAILPLLVIGSTVVIVMLSIAYRRNLLLNAILTVVGLSMSLLSLLFVNQICPIDITPLLRIDRFSIFYTILIILSSLATCTFAYSWLQEFRNNCEEFYLLILIATLGGVVLTSANHMASLFIGISLLSVPLFGLIGYEFHQKRSLEAALKYTILSAVASSFLLFGIALVYADSGSLYFSKLGLNLISDVVHKSLLFTGLGMMIVGIGFKLSLAPFHLWTPDVYQGAPAPASTFLSTASKIAIFSAIMRLFIYAPITNSKSIRYIMVIISIISILFGNLLAIRQNNIKRILGYSSISHFGYLVIALIAVKFYQISMETTSVYLVSYLFSNIGIFGIINLISNRCHESDSDLLYFYRGLFWKNPVLSLLMTIMILSLAGVPITLGFIGKFYLISLGIHASLWWLTSVIIVGSIIGLYYYLRIIINLFLNPLNQCAFNSLNNWEFTTNGLVILVSAILIVFLGIYPQPLISLIQLAMPLI